MDTHANSQSSDDNISFRYRNTLSNFNNLGGRFGEWHTHGHS